MIKMKRLGKDGCSWKVVMGAISLRRSQVESTEEEEANLDGI